MTDSAIDRIPEMEDTINDLQDQVSDLENDKENAYQRINELADALESATGALDTLCAKADDAATVARKVL